MSTLPIFVPTSFEREAMNRAKLKRATRRVPDILANPAAAACAPTEHQKSQEIKGTHFVVRDVINQLKGAQDVLQFPVVNLHAACVAILDSMQHASAAEHVGTSASVAIAGAVQAVVSSVVDVAATDDSGAPAASPVLDVASLMRAVSSPACAWMDFLKTPVIGLTRDGCSLPAMELPLRAVLMSMLEEGLSSAISPAEEPAEKPAGSHTKRGKIKKSKRKRGAKLAPVPAALAAVPGDLGKGLRQHWRARVSPVVASQGHPLYDSNVWAQKLQLPLPRGSAASLAADSESAGMNSGFLMPHARTDVGEMLNDWLVSLPRTPADDTSHAALAEALSPLHTLYEVAAVLRAVPCIWPEALFARSFTVLWQHVLGYARASEQVPIAVVSTAGAAGIGASAEADAQAAEESHQGAAGVDEVSAEGATMPAVLAVYAPADLLGAISPQDMTVLAFAAQPGYELTGAATYLLCSFARVLASVLLCAAADHYQPARRVDFAGDIDDASSQAPSRVAASFASDAGSDGYADDFSESGPSSDAAPGSPVHRPALQPEVPGSPANTYTSDFEATTAPRTPGPVLAQPTQQRPARAATMDDLGGGRAHRGDVGSPTPSKHSRGTAESAQRAGNTTLTERDVHAVLDWAMGALRLHDRARNLLRRGEVEQFCVAVANSYGEDGPSAQDDMGDVTALATSPSMLAAVWQGMSQALLEAVGLGDSRASITLTIRSGVPGHELQRSTMVRLGKGITFGRLLSPVLRAWLLAAHEVVPVWRRTGRMLLSCDTPKGVGMGHWGREEIVIVPLLWVSRHPLAAASAVRRSTCLSGQHLDLTQLWPGMTDIASSALATMAAWSLVRNALTVTPQLVDHMYLQESARRVARAAAAEKQRKLLQRDLPQQPGGVEPVLSSGLDAPPTTSSRLGAATGKPPMRPRSDSGYVPGFKSQVGLGHAHPDFKSNFAASTVRDGLDKQAAVDASVSAQQGASPQDASAAGNSVADEFALMMLRRALSDWWAQIAAWAAVQAADAAAWAAYVEDTEDWSLRGADTVEGSIGPNVALLNDYDERREEPGSERATLPPPSMLTRHGTMRQQRSVESMMPSSEQRLLAVAEWTQLQEVHSKATAQALRAFLPPEALIQTTEPLLAMSAMRRSMGYDATLMDMSTPRLPTLQVKLPTEDVKYNQAPRDAMVAAATASGRDVLWPARSHGAAAPAAGAKQSNASAGMAAVDKAVLDGVARGKELIASAVRAVRVAQQTSAPARLAVVGQRYSDSSAARAWIAAQQACEQADALLRALRSHCKDAADRALGIVKHRSAVLRRADPEQGLAGVASARPGTAPVTSAAAAGASGKSKKSGKKRAADRAKASTPSDGQPAAAAPVKSQSRARAAATKRMALSSRARQREAVAAALEAVEQQRQADEAAATRQQQASTRAHKFDSIYRAAQAQPNDKELQARTCKFIVSLKPQPTRTSTHALEHGQPKFSDILPPPAHALVRHADELAYTARRAEIKPTTKQSPPGPKSPHGAIHWLPKMPAMPESAVWRTSSQAPATPAKPAHKARAAIGPRKRRVQAAATATATNAAQDDAPVNAGLDAGAPMEPPAAGERRSDEPQQVAGASAGATEAASPAGDAPAAVNEHSQASAGYSEDEYDEDEFPAEEA